MSLEIYESMYKDQKAITLENRKLKVKFLPELGGKMASFKYQLTSREILAQRKESKYEVLKYDGNYVDAECSGFDDMFPTIDACYYLGYPWSGIKVPDHGEVCSLKWDYTINNDYLYMCVYGVRFPYKLEKWVSLKSEDELNIKYKATNLSNFDLDFIWAAHPIINAEKGGEVLFPFKKSEAICVFSWDEGFGKYGDKVTWPETVRRDGDLQKLNITGKKNLKGNNYKIYFKEEMNEGWCAYKYPDDLTLELSYPLEKVPYLSLWINEGSFKDMHTIALEPCTGAYDRIDLAKLHGQNSVLKKKGEYNWYLNFKLTV